MIIEFRVLQYFLAIAEEENITRAAEKLHITQPTLSRQISQLEEECGALLFIRGTKKITLTPEEILLRRRAEEILELMNIAQKEIAQMNDLVEGTISIGCGDLYATQILGEMLQSFTELYPKVDFELYTGSANHICDQIDHGLIDLGLLLEPVDLSKLDFIRLNHKERWVAVLPPNSPLLQKETITSKDLIHEPIILPYRLNMQSELAHWFGDDFKKLNILFRSNLTSSSSIMVSQGLGNSIVIEGSISFWDKDKIGYRPLSPALYATAVLAWKRNQPQSLAKSKFIEYVQKYLNEASSQS